MKAQEIKREPERPRPKGRVETKAPPRRKKVPASPSADKPQDDLMAFIERTRKDLEEGKRK